MPNSRTSGRIRIDPLELNFLYNCKIVVQCNRTRIYIISPFSTIRVLLTHKQKQNLAQEINIFAAYFPLPGKSLQTNFDPDKNSFTSFFHQMILHADSFTLM